MTDHFATHRPLLMGNDWMITADHPLAVQAGASVLDNGGNAVDAAVAANAVLTVVRPHMCGIGGDLFMLIHTAASQHTTVLNASGRSPIAADLRWYTNAGYSVMPETGIHTCTVPGVLAGWQAALERHGTMGLDTLMGKAVGYAEQGFPVYSELTEATEVRRADLLASGAAGKIFLPGGTVPRLGQRLCQPQLAKTYRALINDGPDAFYKGPLGEFLVNCSNHLGGFFSETDLASHTVEWQAPISTDYRGYTVITQPPNSQGIALLMQANLADQCNLAKLDLHGSELVHFMVEAKKLAFSDRDAYVCDPAVNRIPVARMLSKDQAKMQIGRMDPSRARGDYPPRNFTRGGNDTVYLSVVDSRGNAVALIQSLYELFGSCVMVPETGMLLHNRGCGFSLDASHPNVLAPGKRPYHTLHTAMILKEDLPWLVLGSPGADGQTQTTMQLLVDMIDFGADPQQACEAPRWRSNPDGSLLMERRFPQTTISDLRSKQHTIDLVDDYHEIMGSAQVIRIDRQNGMLMAGADPRKEAYALGK